MTSSSTTSLSHPSVTTKSFRSRRQLPPYRQPLIKRANGERTSWFTRIKKFFLKKTECLGSNDGRTASQPKNDESHAGNNKSNVPKAKHTIPGGFFSSDESALRLSIDDSMGDTDDGAGNSNICGANVTQGENELIKPGNGLDVATILTRNSNAPTTVATTPGCANSKLAEFFNQKGDAPLSEIEIEGVLSLMKKSQLQSQSQSQSQSHRSSAQARPRSESTLAGSAISGPVLDLSSALLRDTSNAKNSIKVPSFNPTFDASPSPQSVGLVSDNTSGGDGDGGSVGATASKRRRVFNYSELPVPSPYRTVIFRYKGTQHQQQKHIDDRPVWTGNLEVKKSVSVSDRKEKKMEKNDKKLSNTAAALVSLLNESDVTEGNSNRGDSALTHVESVELANPYSSLQLPHIRKANVSSLKEEKIQAADESRFSKSTASKPDASLMVNSTNKKEDTDTNLKSNTTNVGTTIVNGGLSIPKKRSTATGLSEDNGAPAPSVTSVALNNAVPTTTEFVFNQYKPRRSSSLRSTVVTAEEGGRRDQKESGEVSKRQWIKEDVIRKKEKDNENGKEDQATVELPRANNFTFSFKPPTKKETQQQQQQQEKEEGKEDITAKTSYTFGISGESQNEKESKFKYTFDTPAASGTDPSSIDNTKVETYRSMFIF